MSRESSDLQCSRVECEHCGATWLNGVHYWKTGQTSPHSELDLAGLVCNTSYGYPEKCINPKAGENGGDTWEDRMNSIEMNLKRLMEEQ